MTKGEVTRRHIIAKSAAVFNQLGFAGCSLKDVMQATGLEKGGIYRHFASKEELAVEAVRYAMDQAVTARAGNLEQIAGAIPRLMQVVRAFTETPSPIAGGCPLINVAADMDAGSPGIQREAKATLGSWKSKLCGILEEGVACGELRKDVDPRKTANSIISMLEGSLVISRIEGTWQAREDARDTLEVLLRGLAV